MDTNLNNFASDLFPLLVGNDKLKSFLTTDININDPEVNSLAQQFISFHTESEQELIQVFEDLPDIPMHNSYNTTETYGLPLIEKPLSDIENKSESYKLSAWVQAEQALRRYYQDTLRNYDIPEVYKEMVKAQLEKLSNLLTQLETSNAIQS